MKQKLIDMLIDAITGGNRPIRIVFFGGALFGFIIMMVLAKVFGVNTHIGGDTDMTGAALITASLLVGFGISYSIVHFAEVSKGKRAARKQ